MKDKKNMSSLQQWKAFIKFIHREHIPWYLYLLPLVMDMVSANLFVRLPIILGDIMSGDISDMGKIGQYGYMSVGSVIVSYIAIVLFNYVMMKLDITASVGVWNKIIQMPMRKLVKEKPSTLTSRVTDDSTGVTAALGGLVNMISMIYTVVIVYIEMFRMNTALASMLLLVPVWSIITMRVTGNMNFRAQKKIQDTLSVFTSYLSVRLPNMRQVKTFGMEEEERTTGTERIQEQYQAEFKKANVSAFSYLMQTMSTTICNLVVLVYGSTLVARGSMDVGDMISFFLFVTQGSFTYNVEYISLYYQNFKIGLGASAKMLELIDEENEELKKEASLSIPEQDITFKNVSFSYEESPVLDQVSFTIPAGKKTAILGLNGSGKTTVLKLLERIYQPDSGEILYGDRNVEQYHLDEWRQSIGYVVQNSPMRQGTIYENIAYGMRTDDRSKVEEAARKAEAYDFISSMPKGFDSEVGELGGRLSGGQRQKLAIARAIAPSPDLILLDEAACGLDEAGRTEINANLKNILADKTSVLVTHEIESAKDADQIIVLDHGKVVQTGTHEQLMENCDIYQKLCNA